MPGHIIANLVRTVMKVSAHPYENTPVLLVSGVGRSGTTALRHCIGAHPDVHSTETENNIIYDVLETARHNCTYPSRKGTMHVAQPAYDRQFRMLLLNLLWPEPRRGNQRPNMLVASTDLTPDRAEYFLQLFPEGCVAYIVRNGISVISSRTRHPHFSDVPFEQHCEIWTNASAMTKWGEGREGFGLIRQESLIDAGFARDAVADLFAEVGLSFHEACLDVVSKNVYHPTTSGEGAAKQNTDLAQRSERWQQWTDEQRDVFVRVCGPAMHELGYSTPWADKGR